MEPFGLPATLLAAGMASLLAYRAAKRKSLTPLGSTAAFAVAFLLVGTGLRGFNLLVFYAVAMTATKYKKDVKAKIDGTIASHHGSTTRGVTQVLACSLLAVVLSLWHAVVCGAERRVEFLVTANNGDDDNSSNNNNKLAAQLTCAVVAHHATCLADTLASELGILTKGQGPVLITQPWKRVPSGTNGGVTLWGFAWSALGGAMIGMSTIVLDALSGLSTTTSASIAMLVFATLLGLVGSILDSLIGAILQQSYFDPDTKMVYQVEDDKPKTANLLTGYNVLSNEMVNVVSVALTTFLGGWILGEMVFGALVSS